jgi:hypothetical protein
MGAARFLPAGLLIVVGGVFTGQGVGLIPGSFMTGSAFWAIVGAIMLVAGIAIAVAVARQPPA